MGGDPREPSRRKFLSGVAGAAALVAGGTLAAAALGATTSARGRGGGLVSYRGPANEAGPADRPLPAVPVGIDADGSLYGRFPFDAETGVVDLGGEQYSPDWFRYCEYERFEGLRPRSTTRSDGAADSFLRHAPDAPYDWQAGRGGDRLRVDEFEDAASWTPETTARGRGKPALATWRATEERAIPVLVVRTPEVAPPTGEWLAASTADGFVAWAAHCPLDCAVTTFQSNPGSVTFEAGDVVYCPNCQSTFRPFEHDRGRFLAPAWD